jgi:hypothetical protein
VELRASKSSRPPPARPAADRPLPAAEQERPLG